MDLSQRRKFCHQLVYFFEIFVLVEEPRIKSWFDVPATQMSIFIIFESVGVLFEGAFSLWVSLTIFAKSAILDPVYSRTQSVNENKQIRKNPVFLFSFPYVETNYCD